MHADNKRQTDVFTSRNKLIYLVVRSRLGMKIVWYVCMYEGNTSDDHILIFLNLNH